MLYRWAIHETTASQWERTLLLRCRLGTCLLNFCSKWKTNPNWHFSWQTKRHDSVRESNNRKSWFVFLINVGFNYYFCRNFITKSSFSSVLVDRLRVFSREGRNWTHSTTFKFKLANLSNFIYGISNFL